MKNPQDVAAAITRRQIREQRAQGIAPSVVPAEVTPAPIRLSAKNDGRDSVKNPHKVNQQQWRKWDGTARRAFNSLFSFMMLNQSLFHHPNQTLLEDKHWETTAHNAAWTAAEAAMGRYSGDEMGVGESARTQTKTSGKRNAPKPPVNPRRKAPAASKTAIKAKAGRLTAKR